MSFKKKNENIQTIIRFSLISCLNGFIYFRFVCSNKTKNNHRKQTNIRICFPPIKTKFEKKNEEKKTLKPVT